MYALEFSCMVSVSTIVKSSLIVDVSVNVQSSRLEISVLYDCLTFSCYLLKVTGIVIVSITALVMTVGGI